MTSLYDSEEFVIAPDRGFSSAARCAWSVARRASRTVLMRARICLWVSVITLSASGFDAQAEETEPPKPDPQLLTVDRLFRDQEFSGQSVPSIQWQPPLDGYTTLEKPRTGGTGRDLVLHKPATGTSEVLVAAHQFIPFGEETPLSIESYTFSPDRSRLLIYTNSKRVWRTRSRGDYWVLDRTGRQLTKLGGDAPPASLMFAKFSPDGKKVAFVRDNNIYVEDLAGDVIIQLTSDGSVERINGTFDWVYEEELHLRDGIRWSPDSQRVAYWQIDVSGVPHVALVHDLAGLYPEVQSIPYPKTGEQNPAARVGVVAASGGETWWLDIPGDPREHYLAQLDWLENSRELVLQQFNRLQNTNRLMLADIESGAVRTLITETDPAWIEHDNREWRWMDQQRKLVWLSERDGWKHAYAVSRSTGETSLITPGEFDVLDIEAVDDAGGWLYYTASPDNPTERYLFRAKLDGSHAERLTPEGNAGTHAYRVSPDGQWAIHTYSRFDLPPTTELIRLPGHQQVKMFADNAALRKKLGELRPTKSELFRVTIDEGVELDAWCIRPADLDETQKYPVLFYVYGEPWGQTVLNQWFGRSHLWHLMLAQQGYVVMSVDNRGTPAPRGRAWRKIVYRQIGVLASADQAAAVRAILKERPYLDPQRVAIWGWSGGGSMTLNAIFRYPDLYQAGMSVAPVPNQRLYDTIYQERYMGLPSDNADGYHRGSPINFASQLKGHLLLIHGTGDDNCHYQGTASLVDELIAHNKQFTMFAYPSRSHSISERPNTTRHLYGLLTNFLHEKIPPGPQPASTP